MLVFDQGSSAAGPTHRRLVSCIGELAGPTPLVPWPGLCKAQLDGVLSGETLKTVCSCKPSDCSSLLRSGGTRRRPRRAHQDSTTERGTTRGTDTWSDAERRPCATKPGDLHRLDCCGQPIDCYRART